MHRFNRLAALGAAADIGLAPTRHDRFTDISLSTKVFEYAAMNKPVIASRLPLVIRTFPEGTVWTYPAGDASALGGAILAVIDGGDARAESVRRTQLIAQDLSWEHRAPAYLAIVDRLLGSPG